MERQLNQLGAELAELGIPLTVFTVDDYQQLPQVLLNFCQQQSITQLFVNRDIGGMNYNVISRGATAVRCHQNSCAVV